MTRFVSNEEFWDEIQRHVSDGRRARAAVAYFGRDGAKLLKLKSGDTLVVDMSITAVRQGVTDPREVKKLKRAGVESSIQNTPGDDGLVRFRDPNGIVMELKGEA